jgi:hypothetical protein
MEASATIHERYCSVVDPTASVGSYVSRRLSTPRHRMGPHANGGHTSPHFVLPATWVRTDLRNQWPRGPRAQLGTRLANASRPPAPSN